MTTSDTPSRFSDFRSRISQAALVIMVLTFADKILALAKEMLIAAQFGISGDLDVFNLAYALPGLVGLLIQGAVGSAFIPLYVNWTKDGPSETSRNSTMTICLLCMGGSLLLAGMGWVLAGSYFPLIGYGFSAEQMAMGIHMERLLIILVALEGIAAFLAALLRAWKLFAAVTAAQLPINLCLIVLLYWSRPPDILILVYGNLIGSAIKAVWLFIAAARRFSFFARFHFDKKALVEFMALAIPMIGSSLMANANILVDQSMATQLSPGGVSTLRYAYRICDLPLQLIVLSISKAILPFISEQASAKDLAGIRRIFGQTITSLGVIAFPVIAVVMLYGDDIVTVLLRRGAFDAEAARSTALTLRYYTAGLFFFSYLFINGEFFCALQKTRTLFVLGLLSLGLNFGLNILFLRLMNGIEGIALSSTVTSAVLTVVFVIQLSRALELPHPLHMTAGLVAPAIATMVSVLFGLAMRPVIAVAHFKVYVQLGIESLLFLAIFIPIVLIVGGKNTEENQPLWDTAAIGRSIARRFARADRT